MRLTLLYKCNQFIQHTGRKKLLTWQEQPQKKTNMKMAEWVNRMVKGLGA